MNFGTNFASYVRSMSKILAGAQITNGGPIILLQPENEYSLATKDIDLPDVYYWEYLKAQYRQAGIIVPFINNEASPEGIITPTTPAQIDIFGHDGYPLGFDCATPEKWPEDTFPLDWKDLHQSMSPSTPFSILEVFSWLHEIFLKG